MPYGSGAYAVLDLIAALQFVQAHGASFGGDPTNVTIWGLSTGAQLVGHLMICPLAKGLFHRAVLQSCVDLINVRELSSASMAAYSAKVWQGRSAEEWGVALGEELGCAAGANQLEAMRALSAEEIVKQSWTTAAMDCYEPCVDRRPAVGRVAKPMGSLEALRTGAFHRVPVMLGVTEHDGLGKCELEWLMFRDTTSADELDALLNDFLGAMDAADCLGLYPIREANQPRASTPAEVERALDEISNDMWYHASTWVMANELVMAPRPPPVFLYRLTVPGYTGHGEDTPLWNGILPKADLVANPAERITQLATHAACTEQVMGCLCALARAGDPSVPSLPSWPAHTADSALYMELGEGELSTARAETRQLDGRELARCHFWRQQLERMLHPPPRPASGQ